MAPVRTRPTAPGRRSNYRMLGIAVGTAVAVAATVIVTVPEAAHSAPPKPPPRIVFQGTAPNGTEQVFVTNARGTWQRPLTFGPSSAMMPRWSPFGRRILYLRRPPNDEHFPDLMVMGARGRHKHQLLAGRHRNFITDMAWAPRGRRVALAMSRSGAHDVFILNLRTRHLTRLHANSVPDRYPATVAWSPDGKTIGFSAVDYSEDSDQFEDHDLYFIRPTGTGLRQITDTPFKDERKPRWSPDGQRLVYTKASSPCESVVIAAGDGTNPQRVRAGCDAHQATWSPSGRRLLVQKYDRHGVEVIWSTALDGSDRRFITHGLNASWRPR